MGFASGEPDTAITASPMRRVSKRLTANVFHESEVQGPAQLMPSTPKQPASYSGEISSSTITATSRETSTPTAFRAPIMTAAADSNSSDPKDQAIDCGSNPRATDYQPIDPDIPRSDRYRLWPRGIRCLWAPVIAGRFGSIPGHWR